MTLTLPEGVQILTPTTPADDPVWDTAKVSDVDEKIAQMSEDGIQAEIYAFDGACTIAVSAKSSDYSQEIFDLNNLNEEEKSRFFGAHAAVLDGDWQCRVVRQ